MAIGTFSRFRFLNTHFLVTSHALPVISSLQPGPQQIRFIKGLAMATDAAGRLFGYRTVMVACLANGALFAMKITGQFTAFDVPDK